MIYSLESIQKRRQDLIEVFTDRKDFCQHNIDTIEECLAALRTDIQEIQYYLELVDKSLVQFEEQFHAAQRITSLEDQLVCFEKPPF